MKNYISTILMVVAIIVGSLLVSNNNEVKPLGGVTLGPDSATTTNYTWPTASPQGRQVKVGSGTLASVCIGNATAVGTLTLYNASTTRNGGIYGTTTLAVINTGTVGSCFPYNVSFSVGLLAEMSSTLATTTITYN